MAKPTKKLTAEELRCILDYSPETGKFTWKKQISPKTICGNEAGWVSQRGYVMIDINKKRYRAHRLAWLYIYGEWPTRIDHRDTNPENNAIKNLRPCTQSQNLGNIGISKHNTSGYKGVHLHKLTGKWRAAIIHQNKYIHLGLFVKIEDAAAAYAKAAAELFGEFARTS
jgi:hypothetical protein